VFNQNSPTTLFPAGQKEREIDNPLYGKYVPGHFIPHGASTKKFVFLLLHYSGENLRDPSFPPLDPLFLSFTKKEGSKKQIFWYFIL